MRAVLRSVLIVVGVPTLLAAIYFGLFATDVYVSEARFAIRSAEPSGGFGIDDLIASPIANSSSQDATVVVDYVHSHDMLKNIEREIDIREHYSNAAIDRFSRLPPAATREELLDYFVEQVDLIRDTSSDVVTLRVRAFEPQMARELAQRIIELGETLVNEMSNRMELDALTTAREELAIASDKVRAASERLTEFRKVNASLNPAAESSALLGIVSGIESSLIAARAELEEKRAYMREDSPAITSLNNRINALSRQFRLERGRLVGSESGQQMSDLLEGYEPLELEQQLAQQQYASALTSLEFARIEAQRKKQYLVTFIPPNLPDEAVEPRRLRKILTVAVFSFLTYLIGGLMWSALKDHIGR